MRPAVSNIDPENSRIEGDFLQWSAYCLVLAPRHQLPLIWFHRGLRVRQHHLIWNLRQFQRQLRTRPNRPKVYQRIEDLSMGAAYSGMSRDALQSAVDQ